MNTFPGQQKLREFISTRPVFQEMLKGVRQCEMKGNIKTYVKKKGNTLSIYSDSEYSNTVIWLYVKKLTLVLCLKDKKIKITLSLAKYKM